jgi:hypothetical protein
MSEASLHKLTLKRFGALVAEEKLGSDAISKSLRCYDTEVHPTLMERWCALRERFGRGNCVQGATFLYDKDVEGLTGSNVMNYLFKSFYVQEPGDTVELIYPKLSTKTNVFISSYDGLDMRGEVGEWIEHAKFEVDEIVPLRRLAEEELGADVISDIIDNCENSVLTLGIEEFLSSNEFTFPSNQFLHITNRKVTTDLKMKVKYYPSRDDLRAYCADHSRLRSLVASCLNRMISPKSMFKRLNLDSASILRPDKKDVLDIHFIKPSDPDIKTYLLLADISNFTGSLGNSWLMIFIMGLELASGRLEDRTQLFGVGSHVVAASWMELLILYTYLTVGVPCWVEEWSSFEFLSGGFLGVGGNITIGLLCLAMILQDLLKRLRKVCFIRVQAGGDDVAFVVQCSDKDINGICDTIRRELTKYIGNLKEFELIPIDDLDDGVIEGQVFCKKRIILRREGRDWHLEGEPSVPLNQVLTSEHLLSKLYQQVAAWRELDYNLLNFERLMPNHKDITNGIRCLFFERYPNVQPIRTHKTKYLTGRMRVLKVGRSSITDSGFNIVCNIPSICHNNVWSLTSFESKLHHALTLDLVMIEKVGPEKEEVVMLKEERGSLAVIRWVERVVYDCDVSYVDELRNSLTR